MESAATDADTGGSGSLLEGLLDRISELMGDGASMAAFRFAAFEEGRRIGAGYRPDDLGRLLERLDAVLGHRTKVVSDERRLVRLRIHGSNMLSSDRTIVQGIALGVLEGALLASRGSRYSGKVLGRSEEGTEVELKVSEHA